MLDVFNPPTDVETGAAKAAEAARAVESARSRCDAAATAEAALLRTVPPEFRELADRLRGAAHHTALALQALLRAQDAEVAALRDLEEARDRAAAERRTGAD